MDPKPNPSPQPLPVPVDPAPSPQPQPKPRPVGVKPEEKRLAALREQIEQAKEEEEGKFHSWDISTHEKTLRIDVANASAVTQAYKVFERALAGQFESLPLPTLSGTLPQHAISGSLGSQKDDFEAKLKAVMAFLCSRFETDDCLKKIEETQKQKVMAYNDALTTILLDLQRPPQNIKALFASPFKVPPPISQEAVIKRIGNLLSDAVNWSEQEFKDRLMAIRQHAFFFSVEHELLDMALAWQQLCIPDAPLAKKVEWIEKIASFLPKKKEDWADHYHTIVQRGIAAFIAFVGEHPITTEQIQWAEGGTDLANRFDAASQKISAVLKVAIPELTRENAIEDDEALLKQLQEEEDARLARELAGQGGA